MQSLLGEEEVRSHQTRVCGGCFRCGSHGFAIRLRACLVVPDQHNGSKGL